MSEPASHVSPFKGRGRGGRGRNLARANNARLAIKKTTNGRRGRQKLYADVPAQAALERQKELKAAWSTVVNAVAAADQELATRNIDLLLSDPHYHQQAAEHDQVKAQLEQRKQDVIAQHDLRMHADLAVADTNRNVAREIAESSYHNRFAEITDDFVDAQLLRLDLLEYLHDNDLPLQLLDDGYDFHELSLMKAADLGPHVEFRKGIEVPCAKTLAELEARAPKSKALRTPRKRKAEDDLDGHPTPKRPASAMDEAGPADLAPRHIGGLLSAVAPPDEEGAPSPGRESKMPSPSPAPAEGASPPSSEEPAAAKASPADDEKLPPIPHGASEPDAFGVRIVQKRRTANADNNNRIMIPNFLDYEPFEIGFRDSTNDKSRGATKAKRGKYLGTPNSNTLHFDRSLWAYDATLNETGDLDEELVKKHGLHPQYGLFLKSSTNESEPPKKFVSGKVPIVFHTSKGQTWHTSRSVMPAKTSARNEAFAKKAAFKSALSTYCEQQTIDTEDISPPEEAVEEHRQSMLARYYGRPDHDGEETEEETEEAAAQGIATILDAAASVEAEQARVVVPRRPTMSRPFDPVRDVFLPADSPSPPSPKAVVPVHEKLSVLAAMASREAAPPEPQPEWIAHMEAPRMIQMPLQDLQRPGPPPLDPRLYNEPAPEPMNGFPPQQNTFLQTALNPSLQYPPLAPAMPYPGPPLAPAPPPLGMQLDASPGRIPFSNPNLGHGLPGLPALRPTHGRTSLLEEGQPDPSFGPPPQMAMPNAGGYYPPPPPHQPYNHAYPPPDQHAVLQPAPHMAPSQPYLSEVTLQPHNIPPPLQVPPMQPVPLQPAPSALMSHHQIAPYPLSPPFPGHAQLQPSPILESPQSAHQSIPPMGTPTGPRHRASLSSGSAQSKYRKLEPAPTPPHRMGWNSNGSELRTVQYDYREGIKDYTPVEAPPRTGPTTIRGWAHNGMKQRRVGSKSEASPEQDREEPK